MTTLGIIAEYNPFHLGHQYQLQKAKAQVGASCTVIAMSGHFTQRGEPAILDKWLRAEMALAGGGDLVIELPAVFAARSAYYFALGGVLTLAAAQVDYLAFGCETDQPEHLYALAELLAEEPAPYRALRQQYLDRGLSFPRAQYLAAAELLPQAASVLKTPNNLLAVHYLQIIRQFDLAIKPLPIKRIGSAHDSTAVCTAGASASAIRQMLLTSDDAWSSYVPAASAAIIHRALAAGLQPVSIEAFAQSILLLLRRQTPEALAQLPEVSEGLEHRLWQAGQKAHSIAELCALTKSKRYTYTRIQRLLCCLLLNLSQDELDFPAPLYLRILGFNQIGQHLLRELKKRSPLPLVTKTAAAFTALPPSGQAMLAVDCRATDIYYLAYDAAWRTTGRQDFYRCPVLPID